MKFNGSQVESASSVTGRVLAIGPRAYQEFLDAVKTGDRCTAYKATIKLAAAIRGGMTMAECRRATVELVLDTETPEESTDE